MIKIRSRSHNDPQKNKKHLLAASIWILSFHPACSAIVCSDLLSIPPLEWHYSLICTRMLPPAKQSFDNSFLLKNNTCRTSANGPSSEQPRPQPVQVHNRLAEIWCQTQEPTATTTHGVTVNRPSLRFVSTVHLVFLEETTLTECQLPWEK